MTTPDIHLIATNNGPTDVIGRRSRPPGPPSELPALLDGATLAARLGITERHVRRLVAERRIPFIKVGRFVRFDTAAVRAWLERATVEASR